MIRLDSVQVLYETRKVLDVPALEISPAALVAIVGPNGAGKSTLLSILAGLRTSYEGSCYYQGREIRHWSRRELTRTVSFVPQQVDLSFPFTAEQVVLMGRTPHCDGLFESPDDHAAVEGALQLTDTAAFRDRDFRTLSGGERQRVVLASALAQNPKVLLLDEPTTFLDLKHQLAIFDLLRKLAAEGLLVVAVTHDLNLAARYATRIVALDGGRVASDAPTLPPAVIRQVFEVDPGFFLHS
jgi:iron complex transport system ATP-binding protein